MVSYFVFFKAFFSVLTYCSPWLLQQEPLPPSSSNLTHALFWVYPLCSASHTQINSVQICSKCLKKQIASRFFFILCHSPDLYILQSDLEKWEMGNTWRKLQIQFHIILWNSLNEWFWIMDSALWIMRANVLQGTSYWLLVPSD